MEVINYAVDHLNYTPRGVISFSDGCLTSLLSKSRSLLECRNIILIKNNTYDLIVMMWVATITIVACV
jgi:hypothetical protein